MFVFEGDARCLCWAADAGSHELKALMYQRSAEGGYGLGELRFGEHCSDLTTSFQWIAKAAAQGEADAMVKLSGHLSWCYGCTRSQSSRHGVDSRSCRAWTYFGAVLYGTRPLRDRFFGAV